MIGKRQNKLVVSARMRRVRRADTAAERSLQVELRTRRISFVKHISLRCCFPDIILKEPRIAVFVDGDFWHGRILVERGTAALARTFHPAVRAFWVKKIEKNVIRDRRQTCILRRDGWSVIRIWARDLLKNPGLHAQAIERRARLRRDALLSA